MKQRPSPKELWDLKAEEWHRQVGDDDDANRRFITDPVLWRFLGDVDGLDVLDAGCGTGYLSRKLQQRGARVVAVDLSEAMIEKAVALSARDGSSPDFRVESCSELRSLRSGSIDKIVSNFVLMDCADLAGCLGAFHRALRPQGIAVLVFSHPCFPLPDQTAVEEDGAVTYRWRMAYFQEHEVVEPPWRHFSSPFVFYHRPLSGYWRAFKAAGFEVVDFDEPAVSDPPPPGFQESGLERCRLRPNSVAFLLRKAADGGTPHRKL